MRVVSVCLALSVAAGANVASTSAATPFAQDPVVFVHGCMFMAPAALWSAAGYRWIPEYWGPTVKSFRDAGYPDDHIALASFSRPCGSNRANALELAATVEELLARTGKARVDLVGHSMACLSTRLYANSAGLVDDLVEIAGACHGSDLEAGLLLAVNGENEAGPEMIPAYQCSGVQLELNGCFDPDTGARRAPFDETPGPVSALSIYTDTDEVLQPLETACLDQQARADCSASLNELFPGRSHFQIHQDPEVVARTIAFVRD